MLSKKKEPPDPVPLAGEAAPLSLVSMQIFNCEKLFVLKKDNH